MTELNLRERRRIESGDLAAGQKNENRGDVEAEKSIPQIDFGKSHNPRQNDLHSRCL